MIKRQTSPAVGLAIALVSTAALIAGLRGMPPALAHAPGSSAPVHWGMIYHGRDDPRGGRPLGDYGEVIGRIPQVARTYAYFHTRYSLINEHQVAIAESTCSQRRELDVPYIEGVTEQIFAVGTDWKRGSSAPGAIWAARRVPDGHVTVTPNYVRIREIDPADPDTKVSRDYRQVAVDRDALPDVRRPAVQRGIGALGGGFRRQPDAPQVAGGRVGSAGGPRSARAGVLRHAGRGRAEGARPARAGAGRPAGVPDRPDEDADGARGGDVP
jgi:hypothetical protein